MQSVAFVWGHHHYHGSVIAVAITARRNNGTDCIGHTQKNGTVLKVIKNIQGIQKKNSSISKGIKKCTGHTQKNGRVSKLIKNIQGIKKRMVRFQNV
jgi:hypothetical protein